MKRILVPCDFSAISQEAFKFATSLAFKSKGEVIVVKAIDIPIMYETTFGFQPHMFDESLLNDLDRIAIQNFNKLKELSSAPGVPVRFKSLHGPVALTIRDSIDEEKADLVVMGTHGASGWKEYFVGSNTEKIVRTSPVPVMAIRKAPDINSIRSIVFPVTLDLNQPELVARVKSLQEFFAAQLSVLHINTPMHFKRDPEIRKLMEEYARHYGLSNYTLHARNDPYEMDGIISFAHEVKADLIAMATHGRRGLLHVFSGSVAEDVVNHVDCPIWTCSIKGLKQRL